MPTSYLNNVPIEHGELTLISSASAEDVMHHAWQLAVESQRLGVGVMLINTGISKRRFSLADPRPHAGEKYAAQLIIHTSNRGDLVGEADAIAQIVRDCKIGLVIISSWEWTSSTYSRNRRLQFMLREFMEDLEVAAIVYSQSAKHPLAGCIDRGGAGRLAMMAAAVVSLDGVSESVVSAPKPIPLVTHSDEERTEMANVVREATQLITNKINTLAGDVRPKALPATDSSRERGIGVKPFQTPRL